MLTKRIFLIVLILFIRVMLVHAQPWIQSYATVSATSATSAVISKPSGVVSGDLLVVGIMKEKGSGATITTPSGWTLILTTNNSTDAGISTYYKVAGGSEPTSYTFNFSTSQNYSAGIVRIFNAEVTGSPIDVSGGRTGNSGNVIAPTITTTSDNCLVLGFHTNKKPATYTPHPSTTEVYDSPHSTLPSNMLAYFVKTTPGATGAKPANASENEKWAAQSIAIKLSSTPLPIELGSFSASVCNNRSVCLQWQTITEINNDYFTVSRSNDGYTWEDLNRVDGAGNSISYINYSYIDQEPVQGTSYYQLKQTDFDGRYSFSSVISVKLHNYKDDLLPFPNPFTYEATLQTATDFDGATLTFYNSQGRQVDQMTNLSGNSIRIRRNNLPSDLYFIRLSYNDIVIASGKIMIVD